MLKTKLDDPDAVVVLRTAEALGRLGSSDGLEAVRSLAEHERHEVRCWATRLLGRLGTKADIPRLQRLSESRFLDVKFAAIGSLARLGDFTRIELLTDMLGITAKDVRRLAARDPQLAEAIAGMKDAELEAFAADLRRLAARELGETGYAPALEPLGKDDGKRRPAGADDGRLGRVPDPVGVAAVGQTGLADEPSASPRKPGPWNRSWPAAITDLWVHGHASGCHGCGHRLRKACGHASRADSDKRHLAREFLLTLT